MDKKIQIAIDGPAAAGKSTIAKLMAEKLGFVYVDTGAMYRAITWAAKNKQVDLNQEDDVFKVLLGTDIELVPGGTVLVNGHDVTKAIREPDVTAHVSQVATYPTVRDELKKRQVAIARKANVIMDGRDIGTNVLPKADFKFFMVADPKVRAKRRYEENLTRGIASDVEALEKEIIARDKQDMEREHTPLKQADDSILIDTSELKIEEVVDKMMSFVLK